MTGGAGFIVPSSKAFCKNLQDYKIYNLDKLTYAGNLNNLKEIKDFSNYEFIKGDIFDRNLLITCLIQSFDIFI